tara:strand:- start:1261 stop:1617 length:357 start_codon:yes stop_codon:yes gene_type:complete
MAESKRENFVEISLAEYEELKAQIPGDEPAAPPSKPWWHAPDDRGWIWVAPEYFSRWRLFPRAFISMYIYLLFEVTMWFMDLPDPNSQQAGLVSVIVGAGAAWFGLYVNSTSTDFNKE